MNLPSKEPEGPELIAPVRHTVILIAILLGIAGYGVWLQARAPSNGQLVEERGTAVPLYLSLAAAEWGLLRFVVAGGLRRTGTRFRDLLGERWKGWQDVARDVGLGLGAWALWGAIEALVLPRLGPDTARGIATMLPRDLPEIAAWVVLSLTAGFCEEAIFRGYLLTQFRAITGSTAAAILIQGVIFGISHGYQGLRNVITISVLGVLYGAFATWRRSLKPGMILHAWTDLFSGIFASRV